MYSKLAFFVVSAFTLSALAAPYDEGASAPHTLNVSQCNVGVVYCCNSVVGAEDPLLQLIAGLLGIILGPLSGPVGLTCNPIVAGGGTNCNAQTNCCNGPSFSGGLIVLDCTPLNINL